VEAKGVARKNFGGVQVEVHIFIFFCQPKKIVLQNFGGFDPVTPLATPLLEADPP
jgi:hypothetical protein